MKSSGNSETLAGASLALTLVVSAASSGRLSRHWERHYWERLNMHDAMYIQS